LGVGNSEQAVSGQVWVTHRRGKLTREATQEAGKKEGMEKKSVRETREIMVTWITDENLFLGNTKKGGKRGGKS